MERWLQINEFPRYSVSDHGRVRNDETDRLMAMVRNPSGVFGVFLVRDGRQYQRGVAKLVADHFLSHTTDRNTTPVHRDGDRANNRADNLVQRPRWYSNMYHRQFEKYRTPYVPHRIVEVTSGTLFDNSWEAATTLALLENDVARSYHEYHGRGEDYRVLGVYRFQDAR